jgi:hypothetical protein
VTAGTIMLLAPERSPLAGLVEVDETEIVWPGRQGAIRKFGINPMH